MKSKSAYWITRVALIAALYATLTYLAALANLAYGEVQFRFSEALCVLAAFTPAAIPGLTLGCFLANVFSSMGWIDMVFGTFATLLAALATWFLRRWKWLVPLPAVLFNALIIGAEIGVYSFLDGSAAEPFSWGAFWPVFGLFALWVGAGQLAVCYGLGMPLYFAIDKTPPLRGFLTGRKE